MNQTTVPIICHLFDSGAASYAGVPSCLAWAVTALLSACLQPDASPLQASQLSSVAAQALSSAHIGFSTISVFPIVVPVLYKQLCANPRTATVGRRLTAVQQIISDLPEEETAMQTLAGQEGILMGGLLGLDDSAHAAPAGLAGSARQLMQFAVQPTAVVNRTYYLVSHRAVMQYMHWLQSNEVGTHLTPGLYAGCLGNVVHDSPVMTKKFTAPSLQYFLFLIGVFALAYTVRRCRLAGQLGEALKDLRPRSPPFRQYALLTSPQCATILHRAQRQDN